MARWTNIPEWLRGLPVDLDCHTNHGQNDGSRPWILSLSIPNKDWPLDHESWQLCVWHHGPEDDVRLYQRTHGDAQEVVTREALDHGLLMIEANHECDACREWLYSEGEREDLSPEAKTHCAKVLEEHQRKHEEKHLVENDYNREIRAYLMSHWEALQNIVRPMVNT